MSRSNLSQLVSGGNRLWMLTIGALQRLAIFINEWIFTVGEAARSTCGNSHEEKKKEKMMKNDLLTCLLTSQAKTH